MPNTYNSLHFHVVFSTKNREPLLTPNWHPRLFQYMIGIGDNLGVETVRLGGVEDHVHWLCRAPASLSLSEIVQKFKANSSKWVNDERIIAERFQWQEGYAAFTVSKSLVPATSRYVANQERHHRNRDYKSELLLLLRKNEIEFDERFVFD